MHPDKCHVVTSAKRAMSAIVARWFESFLSVAAFLRVSITVSSVAALLLIVAGTVVSVADDSTVESKTANSKTATSKTASSKKISASAKAAETDKQTDSKSEEMKEDDQDTKRPAKIVKTNAEWRRILKPEQFRVTRLKETEQPFTGKFWNNKRAGKYLCVCCGEDLYSSNEKFESGTGWPSFWAPVSEHAIGTETDYSLNEIRTEVHCERCGAHLGHIFDDGPRPTGMRHCINSASLKFVPADTTKSK